MPSINDCHSTTSTAPTSLVNGTTHVYFCPHTRAAYWLAGDKLRTKKCSSYEKDRRYGEASKYEFDTSGARTVDLYAERDYALPICRLLINYTKNSEAEYALSLIDDDIREHALCRIEILGNHTTTTPYDLEQAEQEIAVEIAAPPRRPFKLTHPYEGGGLGR